MEYQDAWMLSNLFLLFSSVPPKAGAMLGAYLKLEGQHLFRLCITLFKHLLKFLLINGTWRNGAHGAILAPKGECFLYTHCDSNWGPKRWRSGWNSARWPAGRSVNVRCSVGCGLGIVWHRDTDTDTRSCSTRSFFYRIRWPPIAQI